MNYCYSLCGYIGHLILKAGYTSNDTVGCTPRMRGEVGLSAGCYSQPTGTARWPIPFSASACPPTATAFLGCPHLEDSIIMCQASAPDGHGAVRAGLGKNVFSPRVDMGLQLARAGQLGGGDRLGAGCLC